MIDADCTLVHAQQTASSNVIITEDPAMTVVEATSATATDNSWTRFYAWVSGGSVAGVFSPAELNIPLKGGKTLYVLSSGAKTHVLLYLEYPDQLSTTT